MKLTTKEQRDLLKQFPKFELSYEKKLHKKVHSDLCISIPKGKYINQNELFYVIFFQKFILIYVFLFQKGKNISPGLKHISVIIFAF